MGKSRAVLGIALFSVIGVGGARARASEEFPTAIREAAGMPCTPSCVICHGVDPGDANTFTRRELGLTMFTYGTRKHDTAKLKASYAAYTSGQPPAVGMANLAAAPHVAAALRGGLDPLTGDDVCIPSYGCGAHVASQAPPRDAWSALWVVGLMALGALVRRQISKAD
jgi:MYXO-CTERM domain-containing protein